MTTRPPFPPQPPPNPPNAEDRARARVLARRAATNGHATTRLNGHTAPFQNPKSKIPNRKPLFVLRHPTPYVRRGRQHKGSGLRALLAGLGGGLGLFLLLLVGGTAGGAWAAWTYITYDLPSVDNIQVSTFQSTKIYDRHGGLLWEVDDPQKGAAPTGPLTRFRAT